jgi:hypothetical protein
MGTLRPDVLIIAACLSAPAIAQTTEPIPQKTVKVEQITKPAGGVGLFEVTPEGAVTIDWRAVEAMAETPHRSEYPIARMMLSIRDGSWKPMPSQR